MFNEFPRFSEIPHPELLNFSEIRYIATTAYCHLYPICKNCPFNSSNHTCMAVNYRYHEQRKQLLEHVKQHNPEYLI